MIKQLFPLLLTLFIVTCESMDIHVKKDGIPNKPEKILIGYFEKRSFQFDPFVAKNLRDALRFDLFKLGYKVELLSTPVTGKQGNALKVYDLNSQKIKEYNYKHSSGLFIQGVISERSYGDAIESETSTLVSLVLYNRDGIKIGEARYISSETLASAETILKVSYSLINKLHSEF